MKYFYIFFLAIIQLTYIEAQDISLYSLDSVWQQNNVNPALFMPQKHHVSVSSIAIGVHSSLSYNDIFTEQNGGLVIDADQLFNKLGDQNSFSFESTFETINVGRHFGKNLYFSFGHAMHQNVEITIPKDLIQMAAEGNGAFLNETAQIGLGLDIHSYNEYYLGLQVNLGNLNLGGRLKALSGIASLRTSKSQLNVFTNGDDIYQITADVDYDLEIGSLLPLENIGDFNYAVNLLDFSGAFKNIGIGLDLGVQLNLTDRFSVSASVIDIGQIKYKNGLSVKSQGNYTYEGLDIQNILTDSIETTSTLDSIVDAFNFTKTQQSVTRPLSTKYYVGAKFKLNKLINLGVVGKFRKDINNDFQGVYGLSADFHIKRSLLIGATYVVEGQNFTNLGARISVKFGKIQFYGVTENILEAFDIKNAKYANVLVGLNYVY